MNNPVLSWSPFSSIPSDAAAAAYSEACVYSLATLEIGCQPDACEFAVTERMHADIWRWAVVDALGQVTDSGTEPTRERAKSAASAALQLAMAGAPCLHSASSMADHCGEWKSPR